MLNITNKMVEIPVNVVDDPTIEDVMKKIPKRDYFSAKTYKKKDYKLIICCIISLIVGFSAGYGLYQARYAELTTKIDKMSAMNEEMQWRTQQAKENIKKVQELSDKYDKESQETVDLIANKIKNRKQKVVEVN